MTVTEIEDSYAPLQSASIEGEGRASSEESGRGGQAAPGPTLAAEWGGPIPQHVRETGEESWPEETPNGNGRPAAEELAPLNKSVDASIVQRDPENPSGLIVPTMANKFEPPDGGTRAWCVMVASFLVNGILFGVINSYSIIHLQLKERLEAKQDPDASFKASLVGSLTIGMTFMLSPVAGYLVEKIGIRTTTLLGGGLAATGMMLSSLFCDKVEVLYLTYGIMYGVGASLAYTPSLVILGHYFKRYMGIVNGFATTGSSVFTVLIPIAMESLLESVGLENLLRCIAGLTAVVMGCALIFKPIMPPAPPTIAQARQRFNYAAKLKEIVNPELWRRKRYVFWVIAIPIALFGYFVPYVHMGAFIEETFSNSDKKMPIICIAITSGIGRLIFGFIADLPRVNRILLQQIAFVSIGLLTLLLSVVGSYALLLVVALSMGLFDGCFISLLGPIAFDLCGPKNAAQALGFLFGFASIPLTAGPAIAGKIHDRLKSYDVAFYMAGIPPIAGGLALFAIRFIKDEGWESESSSPLNQPQAQIGWKIEDKELQDMGKNGQTKSPRNRE